MTKTSPKKPTVSVILPAYNAERYIEESIQSVIRQDFKDYELIIINDGSTDHTQDIIDHYKAVDERIVSINQVNQGLVATLNTGLSMARGEYIARIDGDDPWMSCKLSRQLQEFKHDASLVLIGGGFEVIDEDGYYIETIFPPTENDDLHRALMLRNVFGHAGIMMRKSAAVQAGGYRADVGPTEDYDLWIRLAKLGTIKNLAFPVYRYRINSAGISQQNSNAQATEAKKHVDRQWKEGFPPVLSRHEIIRRSATYLSASRREWYNVALKEQFLADNAQIGIKLIRYGQYSAGIHQIFNVASIGRSGLRAVIKRLRMIDRGSFKMRQHVSVTRTESLE